MMIPPNVVGVTRAAFGSQSGSTLRVFISSARLPPPAACFVVASFVARLALLPALALGWIAAPTWLARLAGWAAAAVFVTRGIGGYLAAFEWMFPLEPFQTFNRLAYSPLCLLLGLLSVVVARGRM